MLDEPSEDLLYKTSLTSTAEGALETTERLCGNGGDASDVEVVSTTHEPASFGSSVSLRVVLDTLGAVGVGSAGNAGDGALPPRRLLQHKQANNWGAQIFGYARYARLPTQVQSSR